MTNEICPVCKLGHDVFGKWYMGFKLISVPDINDPMKDVFQFWSCTDNIEMTRKEIIENKFD